MDSLSNYENMAQNLNQEAQASKMLAFNKYEAAKQEKNSLVEGLTEPLIIHGAQGLARSGLKRVFAKTKSVLPNTTQEAENMSQDYDEGGVRGLAKGFARRRVADAGRVIDTKVAALTDEADGSLKQIALDDVKPTMSSAFKSPTLDSDIYDAVPNNPTTGDLNSALLRQSNRNFLQGESAPDNDARIGNLKARSVKVKSRFNALDEGQQESYANDYKDAKQNATTDNMPNEEERLSARESNATLSENLLDKYESGPAPGNLPAEPVVSGAKAPTAPVRKGGGGIGPDEDPETLDTDAAITEEAGGGPEDPVSDVISLVLGVAGLIGGLEHHTPEQPAPTTFVNPSYQIGA